MERLVTRPSRGTTRRDQRQFQLDEGVQKLKSRWCPVRRQFRRFRRKMEWFTKWCFEEKVRKWDLKSADGGWVGKWKCEVGRKCWNGGKGARLKQGGIGQCGEVMRNNDQSALWKSYSSGRVRIQILLYRYIKKWTRGDDYEHKRDGSLFNQVFGNRRLYWYNLLKNNWRI